MLASDRKLIYLYSGLWEGFMYLNDKIIFEEVFGEVLNTMLLNVADGGNEAVSLCREIIIKRKMRLEKLAEYYSKRYLTDEEFNYEIADEKKILSSQITVLPGLNKTITNKAVNAGIDIYLSAIKRTD